METDPGRMAAIMLGLGDAHVLGAGEDDDGLVVEAETALDPNEVRCPRCQLPVVLDGTEEFEEERPPTFGRATVVIWMLRRFRCEDTECSFETFTEDPPLSPA